MVATISAMSQNELSNSILQTNFLWDYNNQKPALSLNYQYLRLYPTINASAGFSGHEVRSDSTTYRYNQFSTGLSAAVPFRRYWHNHVLSMSLSGQYQFSQMHFASHIFNEPPSMNTFAVGFGIQHSTAKASQYLYTPWLQSLKEYLQGNIREVVDFFSTNDLGIKAIQPQASFLVWLDCRAMGLGQDELMRFFSDKGLLLSNGAAYGQGGEGFVRMNIGCPRKIVKEALGRILRASSGLE